MDKQERADYVIMDNTGRKAKLLVGFAMTKDLADRVSCLLGLAFMNLQTTQEQADWVNNQRGDAFPVRCNSKVNKPVTTKRKNKQRAEMSYRLEKALEHLINRK